MDEGAVAVVTKPRLAVREFVQESAEMLIGGTGVGYFVWNEWNNLALNSVIFAILAIGLVGVILDFGLGRVAKLVAYTD